MHIALIVEISPAVALGLTGVLISIISLGYTLYRGSLQARREKIAETPVAQLCVEYEAYPTPQRAYNYALRFYNYNPSAAFWISDFKIVSTRNPSSRPCDTMRDWLSAILARYSALAVMGDSVSSVPDLTDLSLRRL